LFDSLLPLLDITEFKFISVEFYTYFIVDNYFIFYFGIDYLRTGLFIYYFIYFIYLVIIFCYDCYFDFIDCYFDFEVYYYLYILFGHLAGYGFGNIYVYWLLFIYFDYGIYIC